MTQGDVECTGRTKKICAGMLGEGIHRVEGIPKRTDGCRCKVEGSKLAGQGILICGKVGFIFLECRARTGWWRVFLVFGVRKRARRLRSRAVCTVVRELSARCTRKKEAGSLGKSGKIWERFCRSSRGFRIRGLRDEGDIAIRYCGVLKHSLAGRRLQWI